MQFELLTKKHLSQLIKFEFENRFWFEQFIESRGDDFYNKKSIERHIIDFTEKYYLGDIYPSVIIHNNHIVGRANLKDICLISKTAEIGYRVAKTSTGNGVASFGVEQLIKLSKKKLNLRYLKGTVLDNNPASAKVLEKQGFVQHKKIDNCYNLLGDNLSCTKYLLLIQ